MAYNEKRKVYLKKQIRIFCFFDKGQVVVLTNCFVKKTQKIPKKELELAIKLKKEYFALKKRGV
jgi:phage-related protein